MLKQATLAFAVAAVGAGAPSVPAAAPFSQVIVIGDSLSDTGTFSTVTATGRFTTTPGRLWSEVVADAFGLPVAPAYLYDGAGGFRAVGGGTNYAQSGSLVTGEEGLYDGKSKPIAWQVSKAIERAGGKLGPLALYLVDGGGPDLLLAVMLVGQGRIAPEAARERVEDAARGMARQVRRLRDAGAERIVLLNVADFGVTPMLGAGKGEAAALARGLSSSFNAVLAQELDAARLDVVAPDVRAFFDGVVADPAAHGLLNVIEPGVDQERAAPTPTGNAANSNPSHLVRADATHTHLFADALHPSAKGHELLGRFVLEHLREGR